MRAIHRGIRAIYADDAAKYEADNNKKLKIRRIYETTPSNLERKKKRVVFHHVKKAYVLSNTREITTNGKITYIPIYDVMFLGSNL